MGMIDVFNNILSDPLSVVLSIIAICIFIVGIFKLKSEKDKKTNSLRTHGIDTTKINKTMEKVAEMEKNEEEKMRKIEEYVYECNECSAEYDTEKEADECCSEKFEDKYDLDKSKNILKVLNPDAKDIMEIISNGYELYFSGYDDTNLNVFFKKKNFEVKQNGQV